MSELVSKLQAELEKGHFVVTGEIGPHRLEIHVGERGPALARHGHGGTSGVGSRSESRWAPARPAAATSVVVPSGATSDSRANQCAVGADALAARHTRGRPRIGSDAASGGAS